MAIHTLSICAGIGGLDIGASLAIPEMRTVCYIEREVFAAATLVARMEEQGIHRAPVWDDLTTFDGKPWRGKVDLILAGFPCQPVSVAGKRKGHEDERWLFDDIARIIDEVRPTYIFLENVRGIVSRGLDRVLGALASLGYDAEWGCLQAKQTGATHKRERWFCLAYPSGFAGKRRREAKDLVRTTGAAQENSEQWEWSRSSADHSLGGMAHTSGTRLEGSEWPRAHGEKATTHGPATELRLPCFPPGPNDLERWERVPDALKPAVRRVADGNAYRVDRLRALGNGVVPLQAAVALSLLADRAELC
tara:strand:- start:2146 stop:3063 length:918 start_codon:yes stop_codon:yes gene_type:complete